MNGQIKSMTEKVRGDFLKKFFKSLSFILFIIFSLIFSYSSYIYYSLPDDYKVTENCGLKLEKYKFIKAHSEENLKSMALYNINQKSSNKYLVNIKLLNLIPIKTVNVEYTDEKKVYPCGIPFGVKIFTQGVLIVGISDIKTEYGITSPAKAAGLKKGDIILSINNKSIKDNEELSKVVEESEGKVLECEVMRDGESFKAQIQPLKSKTDNIYRAGLWVRDSSAGIGTLTFYDKSLAFAGLGHGICDVDTGELLSLSHGDIVKANISGIVKGTKGMPGELKGYFIEPNTIGTLYKNTEFGIYGLLNERYMGHKPAIVAMKQQVKIGKAYILTTISGTTPQMYDIEIQNINYNEKMKSKNMIIKITDNRLLSQTGGIIQGMSGSPIIQNDMLVGAITHVFVNDPQKGYAIFAENMLQYLNDLNISNTSSKKSSWLSDPGA